MSLIEVNSLCKNYKIADKEQGLSGMLKHIVAPKYHMKEAVKPVLDNWRDEINVKFNRIQKSASTPFNLLRTEMYCELERRAGCDLSTRLRNRKQRMTDNGCTKTEINKLNRMDVIEEDKKLREIFTKIVSEYEIEYCA